jgi:hypothetical protein
MSHNIIQVFKEEQFDINNFNWHLMTQIPYELKGRKLFNYKLNSVILNSHFPVDKLESIDNFKTYYLSAFSDIEDDNNIDFDYECGFNNMEIDYEKKLITQLSCQSKDNYIIVKPNTYSKDQKKIPDIFNSNSSSYIENKYIVVYKEITENPLYIVKIADLNSLFDLKAYIYGYLISPMTDNINFASIERPLKYFRLEIIDHFLKDFKLIAFRTQIYANYNLTIFTRQFEYSDLKKKLFESAKNCNLLVEEINNINDGKNYLKIGKRI